jgi:hypothetical protein
MWCFLLKEMYDLFIQSATILTPLSKSIEYTHLYYPWFKDYIRVVDGTYIPMSLPKNEKSGIFGILELTDKGIDLCISPLSIWSLDSATPTAGSVGRHD